MSVRRRLLRVFVLAVIAALLPTGATRAAFHLMMVVEVFPGYATAPTAQFVELQMYFGGQNFVGGHAVHVFNAAGTEVGVFTFPPPALANGADQARILIATTQAQTLFGVTADLTMTPVIAAAGGKVCFDGPFPPDCVAWGTYDVGDQGNPFSPAGLVAGRSAHRRLDITGSPTILDPGDDTGDSANDFRSGLPSPTNNAGQAGTAPTLPAAYGSTPAAPGPIVFAPVTTGTSSPASFQIQEAGDAELVVSNPVLGGANSSDFAVVTAFPVNIADGGAPQTVQLTCTPAADGSRTATLTLTTNDPARPTVVYNLGCTGVPLPPGLVFHTIDPCRVVDTRTVGGPLAASVDRTFTMIGPPCGIPASAQAVSLNLAVTQPTASGNVRLYPADAPVPTVSAINYSAGQTRSNNAVVGLSAAGELKARAQPAGTVHLILDVNGYFDDGCPVPTRTCYEGPPGTLGVGVCSAGSQNCTAGVFGPCIGQTLPSPESCNLVDDDCDGITDEGCP